MNTLILLIIILALVCVVIFFYIKLKRTQTKLDNYVIKVIPAFKAELNKDLHRDYKTMKEIAERTTELNNKLIAEKKDAIKELYEVKQKYNAEAADNYRLQNQFIDIQHYINEDRINEEFKAALAEIRAEQEARRAKIKTLFA